MRPYHPRGATRLRQLFPCGRARFAEPADFSHPKTAAAATESFISVRRPWILSRASTDFLALLPENQPDSKLIIVVQRRPRQAECANLLTL